MDGAFSLPLAPAGIDPVAEGLKPFPLRSPFVLRPGARHEPARPALLPVGASSPPARPFEGALSLTTGALRCTCCISAEVKRWQKYIETGPPFPYSMIYRVRQEDGGEAARHGRRLFKSGPSPFRLTVGWRIGEKMAQRQYPPRFVIRHEDAVLSIPMLPRGREVT
jgi:hypothetical protein